MGRLILNCDLGEEEPLEQTEQILSLVDAANIACGEHAGNLDKTRITIERALVHQVLIGAHPGLPSAGGRGKILPDAQTFHQLLERQLDAFEEATSALGAPLDYIKLHGSLYSAVEVEADLAEVYLNFLRTRKPGVAVFALAGGRFAQAAEAAGIQVYHEAFADRAYEFDGSLRSRSSQGAVLAEREAVERFQVWREQGTMPTNCGRAIPIKADTLCVHGDSPGALAMIESIRKLI